MARGSGVVGVNAIHLVCRSTCIISFRFYQSSRDAHLISHTQLEILLSLFLSCLLRLCPLANKGQPDQLKIKESSINPESNKIFLRVAWIWWGILWVKAPGSFLLMGRLSTNKKNNNSVKQPARRHLWTAARLLGLSLRVGGVSCTRALNCSAVWLARPFSICHDY